MGRKSDFKKSFCKKVEEFLGRGYSQRAACSELKISMQTFWKWKKEFPEFGEACEAGVAACEKFYIDKALRLIDGEKGSYPSLIFMMKNILKWSDNPVVDEDTQPVTINFITKKED